MNSEEIMREEEDQKAGERLCRGLLVALGVIVLAVAVVFVPKLFMHPKKLTVKVKEIWIRRLHIEGSRLDMAMGGTIIYGNPNNQLRAKVGRTDVEIQLKTMIWEVVLAPITIEANGGQMNSFALVYANKTDRGKLTGELAEKSVAEEIQKMMNVGVNEVDDIGEETYDVDISEDYNDTASPPGSLPLGRLHDPIEWADGESLKLSFTVNMAAHSDYKYGLWTKRLITRATCKLQLENITVEGFGRGFLVHKIYDKEDLCGVVDLTPENQ